MRKNFIIKIFGKVQGVGYRFSAKSKSESLNISGFVRNEPDGSVYIEAEGDEKNLKKFLKWCSEGPEFAKVKRVETSEGKVQKYKEFKIKF